MQSHPFLDESFEILWSRLTPDAIELDIEKALVSAEEKISAIANEVPETLTFENTILALEQATEGLNDAWGKVEHLMAVSDSEELREAEKKMLPKVTDFNSKISLNPKLWARVKAYSETEEAKSLTRTQKRCLEEMIADFEENGANLPDDKKKRFEEIQSELAEITTKFDQNVKDSRNDWELIIEDEADLKGLPEPVKAAAKQSALSKEIGTDEEPKWRLTLDAPCVMPVLSKLENEEIRRRTWEGFQEIGLKGKWDNTDLIWRILALRQEKADLLGKANFADVVLERRMAKDGATALGFVEDLHARTRDAFQKECQELEAYRAEKTGESGLFEPWDAAIWAEKQRIEKYDFDDEELRPYFPIDGVLDGMFRIVESIFDVKIENY